MLGLPNGFQDVEIGIFLQFRNYYLLMDLENRFQTDKLGCSRKGSSPIDHEEELEKRKKIKGV